jgi:hypothetical protein
LEDVGQQPQFVPLDFRVLGQGSEVATDQQRLIALPSTSWKSLR